MFLSVMGVDELQNHDRAQLQPPCSRTALLSHRRAPCHRVTLQTFWPPMSLALDYSSDDAELAASVAKDAFGIASLTSNEKPRVEEPTESQPAKADAAPHVLSEVSFFPLLQTFQ
jgi:hypothetical protein